MHHDVRLILHTSGGELLALRGKHYVRDQEGHAPYFVPHDLVILENRKGWTRRQGGTHAVLGEFYKESKSVLQL